MKRGWMIILILVGFLVSMHANRSELYEAYLSNDMELWEVTMVRMEAELIKSGGTKERYELTEAQYGYIAYCLSEGRKKEADYWLEKAEKNLEYLMKSDGNNPKLYSLKGALTGFALLLEPVKAPILGRRSANANDRALELDPSEPIVWMEKGNMEFYKPAILGGSASDAIPHYERAVRLFESSPGGTVENWLYLHSMIHLAQAYEIDGQPREAGEMYRKVLKMEPSFASIKDELYPSFREKHPDH